MDTCYALGLSSPHAQMECFLRQYFLLGKSRIFAIDVVSLITSQAAIILLTLRNYGLIFVWSF